jgi:type III pantothenate kinase
MQPDQVVDIGNSHIKWGRCTPTGVTTVRRLSATDPDEWDQAYLAEGSPRCWAIASVHPDRREAFVAWLLQRRADSRIWVIASHRAIPLPLQVDFPERVGLDRLLDALAARARVPLGTPAIIADIGTAVTVDLLDGRGTFCGGSIFPGLRLMAEALHTYTAQLPRIDPTTSVPPIPGRNTTDAMHTGIVHAVVGGIQTLATGLGHRGSDVPMRLLTGGDAELLAPLLGSGWQHEPLLTLDGIRLAALEQLE